MRAVNADGPPLLKSVGIWERRRRAVVEVPSGPRNGRRRDLYGVRPPNSGAFGLAANTNAHWVVLDQLCRMRARNPEVKHSWVSWEMHTALTAVPPHREGGGRLASSRPATFGFKRDRMPLLFVPCGTSYLLLVRLFFQEEGVCGGRKNKDLGHGNPGHASGRNDGKESS